MKPNMWRIGRDVLASPYDETAVGPFIGFDKSQERFIVFARTDARVETIGSGSSISEALQSAKRRIESNQAPKSTRACQRYDHEQSRP